MPAEKRVTYAVIMQVVIAIFVLDPVYAFIFPFTAGIIERKYTESYIIPTIKADYFPILFWLTVLGVIVAPAQIYLFKHIPVK